MEILKHLNGSKTYIGLIGLGLIGLLVEFGKIDAETARTWGIVLGTWTGVSLRHALQKIEDAR